MHPVIIQTFYYGVVMSLVVFGMGFFLKGFFWKYLKVRMSFGKYVLVKLSEINRDFFSIGEVSDGFLIYSHNKSDKRIKISNSTPFYRCLAVSWIDIDNEKNVIISRDGSEVNGFDAEAYSHLYTRALMRPSLNANREKIILTLLVIICIALLVIALLNWQSYSLLTYVRENIGRGVISSSPI